MATLLKTIMFIIKVENALQTETVSRMSSNLFLLAQQKPTSEWNKKGQETVVGHRKIETGWRDDTYLRIVQLQRRAQSGREEC